MSRFAQPDLHPDADSLNAFAEQALPAAERARIMSHMAGCERCRQVVYLARTAAEAETPLVSSAAKAEPRRGWFAGAGKWRMAWIPAATLAAVAGVVLWVQVRPTPPSPPVARNGMPPPPASDETQAASSRAVSADPAIKAGRPAVPPSVRETRKPTPVPPAVSGIARSEMDINLPPSPPPVRSESPASGSSVSAFRAGPNMAALAHRAAPQPSAPLPSPALAKTQWQPLPPQPATVPSGPANATLQPAPPSMDPFAVQRSITPGALNPPSAELGLMPQPMNGIAVMGLARHTRLPSGRNPVSSAAILDRLVAVDSAGSLFLSHDFGKHWEAIPVPWEGKALLVQAPPHSNTQVMATADESHGLMNASATTSPASPAPPADAAAVPAAETAPAVLPPATAPAAPPFPAMLFRLVTDRHQTWISADGKIWRRQ